MPESSTSRIPSGASAIVGRLVEDRASIFVMGLARDRRDSRRPTECTCHTCEPRVDRHGVQFGRPETYLPVHNPLRNESRASESQKVLEEQDLAI